MGSQSLPFVISAQSACNERVQLADVRFIFSFKKGYKLGLICLHPGIDILKKNTLINYIYKRVKVLQ